MQHFKSLPPAERYRYLSSVLHQQNGIQSPPSAVGETFEFLSPLLKESFTLNLTPLFLGKNYDAFLRYDYIRRSLLTASLYLSKPLTENQVKAIVFHSDMQYDIRASIQSTIPISTIASLCISAVAFIRLRSRHISSKKRDFWKKLNVIWVYPIFEAGLDVAHL